MDSLPEDVLIHFMKKYLDIPSLLTCRIVCRRFWTIVGSPSVWCHRAILRSREPCLCPALRVAPRLDGLTLQVPMPDGNCGISGYESWATTKCAVSSLDLLVLGQMPGPWIYGLVVRIIKNQEFLGCLRKVTLHLNLTTYPVEAQEVVFTLLTTANLDSLHLYGVEMGSAVQFPEPASQLSYFFCQLTERSESFCCYVLAKSGASLKHVDVSRGLVDDPAAPASSLTKVSVALSRLPKLQKLSCRLLPGLNELAACTTLTDLSLVVRDCDEEGLQDALHLISAATQLQVLTLEHEPADSVGLCAELVRMAGSFLKKLERLNIRNGPPPHHDDAHLMVEPLLSALSSLPALQHLELETAPDGVLRNISPATVPGLLTLTLEYNMFIDLEDEPVCCLHSWLHCPEVSTFMAANPSIRVLVPATEVFCTEDREFKCVRCVIGCHLSLMDHNLDRTVPGRIVLPRNI